jgi:hypothetical protein
MELQKELSASLIAIIATIALLLKPERFANKVSERPVNVLFGLLHNLRSFHIAPCLQRLNEVGLLLALCHL